MIDWTYGILQSSVESKKKKLVWQRNPIYLDNIRIHKNKAIKFRLEGQGKIIQISFTSDSKSATLGFGIDGQPEIKVNNGYCLTNICDTRGIGYAQIQEIDTQGKLIYRYTFLIPAIFNEKIDVLIVNEAIEHKNISVSDVHIYYLVPREVK